MKRCSRCGKEHAKTEFRLRKDSPDGTAGVCKPCERSRNRARYAAANNAAAHDARPTQPSPPPFAPDKPRPPPPTAEAIRGEFKDRQTITALRARVATLVEENDRFSRLLEEVAPLEAAGVTVITKAAYEVGDAIPILVASDWHVEEPVDPLTVNNLNRYDLEIADRRAKKFFQNGLRLVDLAGRDSNIKTMRFAALGDFFSGSIHDELMEINELRPGDAAGFAKDLLAAGLRYWLKESKYNIEVDFMDGNHGRMTKKRRHAGRMGNSLEAFMYASLAKEFAAEPRIRFNMCRGAQLYVRLFDDYVVRYIHGDDVNYQGGIGGITVPIRKAISEWNKAIPADLTIMGHFHQKLDGGDFIVNGSLIGYNAFALSIKASPEEPQQTFVLVHARNGGTKSLVAPIWVE